MQCLKKLILATLIIVSCSNFGFSQEENIMENRFLMVLDLQDYYLRNTMDSTEAENFISKVNELISKTEANNIIYVKSVHKVLNLSLKSPFIYVSVDTMAMQLYNGLNIVNDNIFTKEKPDAFSISEMVEFLKTKNIKEIVLIGLMAEECISETSKGGIENGYDIYLVPHAIIGKTEKSKEKSFRILKEKGVKILDFKSTI